MSLTRKSFFVLVYFAFTLAAIGQEPKLIDKFERLPCSDLRGRTDNLLATLSQNGDLVGYVVVSDDNAFHNAVARRALFQNHIFTRGFDSARIRYVRRSGLGKDGVEFWIVPSNVSAPFEYKGEWDYQLPEGARSFKIYEGGFNESECLYPSGTDILLNYLKANPGSRGNVVIHSNGRGQFAEIKESVENEVRETDSLALGRFRYFYAPIKSIYFKTEFWVLP